MSAKPPKKTEKNNSRAWQEGFAAAQAGRFKCPYAQDDPAAYDWHVGHIEGDAARRGFAHVVRVTRKRDPKK
ncbi:MAG: hypothetical protein WBL61_01795 [Bryobacteraceae bacterium]